MKDCTAHWIGRLMIFFSILTLGAVSAVAQTYSGPLVITLSGTYSGNWASTDPATAAVTISTSGAVVIVNSCLRGPGHLISALNVRTYNVTVKNCYGYGVNPNVSGKTKGNFVNLPLVSNLDVENCQVENTGGGVLVNQYSGLYDGVNTIKIKNNRFINMDGRLSDGTGGYQPTGHALLHTIMLDNVRAVPGIEIAWNEMINTPYASAGEDVINMHRTSGTPTSHLLVYDNYIYGAWPTDPATEGYSGGGIITDGAATDTATTATAFTEVYNNQVVATVNYGIAIASGHDNSFHNNRVLSSGLLPDGTWIHGQNVGAYGWNYANQPTTTFFNNSINSNLVGWMKQNGRNDL